MLGSSSPRSSSAAGSKSMNALTFWGAVFGVSVLKLLLLNSYRSTDFEVHRNWLAITHSLPLDKWYYEKTSEWTLDYPPFFAYFEWGLSQVAKYFDKDMVQISNLNYASPQTILFQKLSVILVDVLLAYSVLRCSLSSHVLLSNTSPRRGSGDAKSSRSQLEILFILIFLNGGLLIVDHIHFQYNGFLFGILLLSISKCLDGKYYQSAAIFAALLNFKHIFLYMAPAFGVYFLRRQCFPPSVPLRIPSILKSLSSFALVGVSVLALSLGPFYQHIPQILQRLFPFQRGLSHAYWAPNVWAGYNTLDWLLNILLNKNRTSSSVTSGLVGTASLSYLPQILPIHTFLLTLLFILPSLYKLWQSPSPTNFIRSVTLTAWTSFMFGYHVHEKAILNVIIPFSLIATQEPNLFFLILTTGTVSLFPLLFTPAEILLKAIILILHLSLTSQILHLQKFRIYEILYLVGFIGVYIFENLGIAVLPNYPFLPLLLVSDYCFLGVLYCYVKFYWNYIAVTTAGKATTSKSVRMSETHSVTTITFTSSFSRPSASVNGAVKTLPAPSLSPLPQKPKKSISPKTTSSPQSKSPSSPPSKTKPSRKSIPASDRVLRKRTK